LILANLLPVPAQFHYLVNLAIGLVAGGVVVSMETVMQRAVPDSMRGRVFAFNNLLLNTLLLGSLLAGARILRASAGTGALGSIDGRLLLWTICTAVLAFVGAGIALIGLPRGLAIADVHASETQP